VNKRLVSSVAAAGAALLPMVALAQTELGPTDNASNTIGALVAWLLVGGGAFSVFVMIGVDRNLQTRRR
jgi:hypothetical protein